MIINSFLPNYESLYFGTPCQTSSFQLDCSSRRGDAMFITTNTWSPVVLLLPCDCYWRQLPRAVTTAQPRTEASHCILSSLPSVHTLLFPVIQFYLYSSCIYFPLWFLFTSILRIRSLDMFRFHNYIIIIINFMIDHKICSNHIGIFRRHLPIFSLGVHRLYALWVYIHLLCGLVYKVRFQVLTAASMKFTFFFWDVLPCKIIVERRFRGTCCLHHYRPDDGGSTYLWNVGRQLFYTAVHPRTQIWAS
jgi:hypothetical protein